MKVTDDKPDIILFYNSTKAGVDVLDKCIRTYSCCRGTRKVTRNAVTNIPNKGGCYLCPRSKDRKYMKICTSCNKYICSAHMTEEESIPNRTCNG
ncbi:hypothetical protein ANN_26923 [Periplaneta americana]|uniref:PiggyBac transposable element-derived protein 4 C-terminal zinc-ribbon domain-containing protein n=1 Tax=Periplaneta americana TaxID=6978 RepID=A0ABQ8RWM1_PERAM|nr:hypothetical protein ANN_26923 [Periplaneta americana]